MLGRTSAWSYPKRKRLMIELRFLACFLLRIEKRRMII
jgi:hypothetical protein